MKRIAYALTALGVAVAIAGLILVYPPLAFLVGGTCLVALGLLGIEVE